jgi:hypothetical protein
MGEPRYNQMKLEAALDWIRANPKRFNELCARRFIAFWFPNEESSIYNFLTPGRRAERYAIYAMTLLSIVGLWICFRLDTVTAMLCSVWLCVFPLIYYVTQYEDRYRHPILWVSFLLGALPLSIAVKYLWGRAVSGPLTRYVNSRCAAT